MKTLTKITLSLLALAALAAAPIVRAQNADTNKSERRSPDGPGGGMGEERIKAMAERLGLTADQKTKLVAVAKTQRDALAKLRDDESLTREARREKLQSIRTTQQAEVRAILTAEQAAKWESAMAEGVRRGGPGGREGKGKNNAGAR
jgi:Spy/CpxP family protein refolding chaperone